MGSIPIWSIPKGNTKMNQLESRSKSGLKVYECPFPLCQVDKISPDCVGYHIVKHHTPELLKLINNE